MRERFWITHSIERRERGEEQRAMEEEAFFYE